MYFNLIVGKEAAHLIQISYLLNADIHSRKRELCLLFSDKYRQPHPKSLGILRKCIDDIINHKIHEITKVHKMRFQRLLHSADWKALSKDVTFEYDADTETLRYWIHCGLYSVERPPAPSSVAIFGEPEMMEQEDGNGVILNLQTVDDVEREITEKVHKLLHWHCSEELMSGFDVRPGFMPLIRGVDGRHILEIAEQCKMEFARTEIRQHRVHIKMPQTRSQIDDQKDAVTQSKEYVLDTFMRDSKDGKWSGNDAHKIWIFSNNVELLRQFKMRLFRMCRDCEVMFLIRELKEFQQELGTKRQFHIEKGMMKTRTAAKIYSNGTELYIMGTEEERERARKWVREMLQEWKLRFIGSQQQEELKLATIRSDYQDLNKNEHTQTVSDANDSDLLARF